MKNYKEIKIMLLQVLTGVTFSSALIVPYYFSNGVLNTDLFLLFGIYQIAILVLEIPTGLFSSKFGEKKGLSLGYLFMFLFSILINFGDGFLFFAFLQIILATSKAFQSGSINALIYDYTTQNNLNHKKVRGNYQVLGLIIGVITTIIGSFLVLKLGYNWIFYLEAILFLVASLYVLSFKLDETYKIENNTFSILLKNSLKFLKQNKKLSFYSIILYALLGLEAGIYISMQEIYLNILKLPLEYLGGVLTTLTLFSMIFTKIIYKKDYSHISIFIFLSLITFIISSGLNYFFPTIIFFVLFFFTQIVRGVNIIIDDKILSNINKRIGSSTLSLLSFSERITFFIFSLIVSIFKINALLIIFIVSLILFIFLCIFNKKYVKKHFN